MKIEVYGTGCTKCLYLYERTQKAVEQLGIEAEVEKVEDLLKIMNAGVMTTPALAVDGVVKVSGRLLEVEEIKEILS